MKLRNIFKKSQVEEKSSKFSNFFRYASEEEKIKIFTEAARRANEDQRETYRKAQLKTKGT